MSNLDDLNNQVYRGFPYRQLPPYFDLPNVLMENPYQRSWPTELPSPFEQNKYIDDTGRCIVSNANAYMGEQRQASREYYPSNQNQDQSREYYGGVHPSQSQMVRRRVMSPELYMINDLLNKKDTTIMLLVGLAVLEGLVILSLTKSRSN